MRIALVALLFPSLAAAEPSWRVDLSLAGVGSFELDPSAPHMRDGVVPALDARVQRTIGRVHLGGVIGAGFPAWFGRADLAASADLEHVIAPRYSITTGIDAGVGLYYFDAPPMTDSSSNALVYWGPLVRSRVQLHMLHVMPNRRAIGVVVGVHATLRSAHYTSTADGSGTRFEPGIEVGLTTRL